MKKIIVYCEINFANKKLDEVSYEMISKAYALANNVNDEYLVEAVVLSDKIDKESIAKSFDAGASRFVFIKEDCLATFSQTVFSQCFVEYYNKANADIIIFPATPKGRMVAPRVASILNTGLVADCTELEFITRDGNSYFAPTRPTFGSELMATILSKTLPQCATVRPQTFKAEFGKNIKGELFEFIPTSLREDRVKLVETFIDNSVDVADFTNAKIVLAAGYGLVDHKDRKYFSRLEQIAKIINAKVASTRKVVDLGFMDHSTQIGVTGATVEAEIYIAFGISGAIQHISGMKNCKTIIAINTDENADIFNYADYKIVADAKLIIDELLEKLS